MDGVVDSAKPVSRGGGKAVRVPDVRHDGDVVVPVQEVELVFARDDEERVTQLRQFGEHEEEAPDGYLWGVEGLTVAQAVVKALVEGHPEEAGDDGDGADDAEGRQPGVPHDEGPSEVVGGSLFHPALPREYQ